MSEEFYFLAPVSSLIPEGLEAYLPLDPETIEAIDAKVSYTEANLIVEEDGLGFDAMFVVTGELSLEFP